MLKPRLEKFYETIVSEDFILLYNFKNISSLTCFERAILNSTSSTFGSEPISTMQSFSAWLIGTSQKCVSTRARKSIALFGIRKSNLLGLKVTCRKNALFTLLDKLLIFVLPRLLSNSVKSISSTLPSANKRFSSKILLEKELHLKKIQKVKNNTENFCGNTIKPTVEIINSFTSFNQKSTLPFVEGNKATEQHLHCTNQGRSFFVISNKSTLIFPEVSQLLTFFDSISGFALSCSILHKSKCKNIKIKKNHNLNLVKNQFLSAFQYPVIFAEDNSSFLTRNKR